MSASSPPQWRRLEDTESFRHDYQPYAGDRRGYTIDTKVLMFGHENCGCYLSHTPVKVDWFLPHSDEYHGSYPMHYTRKDPWIQILRSKVSRERPGWIVYMSNFLSYGAIYVKRELDL